MSDITTGFGKSGHEWARQTIVIDVPGYQGTITKLSFQVGTDRIDDVQDFLVGDRVEIGWSIYAREWNGKWYNNVDLVNIKSQDAVAPQEANAQSVTTAAPIPALAPARRARAVQASAPQAMNIPASDLDPAAHEDDLPF